LENGLTIVELGFEEIAAFISDNAVVPVSMVTFGVITFVECLDKITGELSLAFTTIGNRAGKILK
jgi:hypothetical protein